MVEDPVEGGGRQDGVDGLLELELQQIETAHVGVGPRVARGPRDHRGGRVDGDHPALRQPLDERLGDPPGAAAGIQHVSSPRSSSRVEDLEPERLHRSGDAVVGLAVPLVCLGIRPYVITY